MNNEDEEWIGNEIQIGSWQVCPKGLRNNKEGRKEANVAYPNMIWRRQKKKKLDETFKIERRSQGVNLRVSCDTNQWKAKKLACSLSLLLSRLSKKGLREKIQSSILSRYCDCLSDSSFFLFLPRVTFFHKEWKSCRFFMFASSKNAFKISRIGSSGGVRVLYMSKLQQQLIRRNESKLPFNREWRRLLLNCSMITVCNFFYCVCCPEWDGGGSSGRRKRLSGSRRQCSLHIWIKARRGIASKPTYFFTRIVWSQIYKKARWKFWPLCM